MSSINSVGGGSPVQKIVSNPVQRSVAPEAPKQTPAADKLELSGVGHLMRNLKTGNDMRADKVAEIKAQIEAGTYEDDKKLDAAVDRLLDDLLP